MQGSAGIILAGGAARRMGGGDKGFRPLGDARLIDHVVARFAPQVGRMAISANGDAARFAGFGLPVRADPVAGLPGPLAGVLAGLDWAADLGLAGVVSVAADTPFVPRDLVARLGAAGAFAVAADARGVVQPTCALWPVTLCGPLRAALQAGTRRVGDWALAQGAEVVRFPGEAAFFNVNTPEDLMQAEALLRAGA